MHRSRAVKSGLIRRGRYAGALIATAALAMAASPALAASSSAAALSPHVSGKTAAQIKAERVKAARNKAARLAAMRRSRHPLSAADLAVEAADRAASAKARQLGRNVMVTSQTTPVSTTVAHPNGTFTTTTYALPVRIEVNGRWTPVSTRLRRTGTGWSPAAVPSGLTFSPGGNRPLVSMTSPQGSLALTFPALLPAPAIRGSTATYRNALPGVSLALTATTLGGVALTFTIASARAAASPALRHLYLTLTTRGLTARTDRTGNIAATARGVGEIFSGPPATSWDSPGPGNHRVAPADQGAELHPALRGATLHINPDPALLGSASRYPAYISQSLTPDFPASPFRARTSAGRPGSPSAVTPAFTLPKPQAGRAHFIEEQKGCSGAQNYDIPQGSGSETGNGIGYNFWQSCIGPYRSFYSFNVNASRSWQVISAQLSIAQTYSADLNCNDKWAINLYSIGRSTGFNSSSDWSNYQPAQNGTNSEGSDSVKVGEPACADHTATFSVTDAMTSAASVAADQWTFGIKSDESQNPSSGVPTNCSTQNCAFSRWSDNPVIDTTYDEFPPAPSGLAVSPSPLDTPISTSADNGCSSNGSAGGWIGKTTLENGGNTVNLSASFDAALSGESVQGQYDFWENTPINGGAGTTPTTGFFVGPKTVPEPVGMALEDGASYQWDATAFVNGDGQDGSAGGFSQQSNVICGFRVDETAPVVPTVSSSDFPPLGSVPGTTLTTGNTGQFNFTSYDPVPTGGDCDVGGCLASGVYEFEYELNSPIPANITAPTASTSCPSNGVTDGVLYGVAATNGGGTSSNPATGTSCPIKIGNWGTNTLYVAAIDTAGNISQSYQYQFYVPWNGAAPVAGDVNGDGYPDLLATSSNGDLLLFPGRTDPTATPEIASTAAQSPQPGVGWNNYQITHRGSFSQYQVDDVFALRGANLYRYLNNTKTGTTPQFENTANVRPVNWPPCPQPLMEGDPDNPNNCSGYPSGWAQISQIVAPGDAWTGANPYNASTFGNTGITQDDLDPSLLAVSKTGQLWLFQGNGGGQLQDPVQLGSSGWNNMTVVAPGSVNGTGVLWARDNSTGTLYSYPFVLSSNDVPTMNPATPSSPIPAEGTGTTGAPISGAPTLTKAAYPTLTAALPLATGSGGCSTSNPGYYCPGLYAEDTSGNIWYYPGQPVSGSPISGTAQLYFSSLKPSAYWPLGDNVNGACSATNADTTGNGNTGTPNGGVSCTADPAAPATEPNPPMVDSFDGSSGYITSSNPAVATGPQRDFSVSAWVYLTSNSQYGTAVSQDTSASDSGGAVNSSFKLMYRTDSNAWAFSLPASNTSGATVISATSAPLTSSGLSTWTQLTGTYDASSGLMTLYVNGQPAGTATDTTPFASTGPTVIGRDLVGGNQADFFPGDIKDVQVYSYRLSAAQAEALYQAPAASLPLDSQASGGVLADATGDGYSATVSASGVSWPVDKYFGTVADFDGSTGYAATSGPVVDTSGSFTVSAWAYLTSLPTHNSTMVSQQGTNDSSFYLQYNYAYAGAPRWGFVMPQSDIVGPGMSNAISASAAQANTWTQLTGVYNAATNTLQLYINGQLVASGSATGWLASGPLDIGRALWAGNYSDYFPGEVSDVQAFSYALSPGAVQALYLGQNPINQVS